MHHFATRQLHDVFENWKDMFYPGGVKTSAQADLDAINDDKAAREKTKRTRALEREERHQRRSAVDEMLMAVPYMLFPRDQAMASFRKAKEEAAAAEKQRVRENVDAWVHQVASAQVTCCKGNVFAAVFISFVLHILTNFAVPTGE
jgi:hypothetical protein